MEKIFSWDNICKAFTIAVLVFIFALTSFYTFSTKEFDGYYLSKGGGERGNHKIWINWNNAPDELAFESTHPDEVLKVFKTLTDNTVK